MPNIVTIERSKVDSYHLHGVVVAQSPALTLVHQLVDFQFDGFFVVRTKDITSCQSSRGDDYVREIIRRERLWEQIPRWVKRLPVSGWPELISKFAGKVVILEDEVKDEFYIGPIVEVRSKKVLMHYFDCCGVFMEVEGVRYNRITSMRFGDRYSTLHAKYLSAPQT